MSASLQLRAAEAEAVLARTDHTHTVLAALSTALMVAAAAGVGVTGADATLPTAGQPLMATALATVAASLLVLLTAIRPRRGVPVHATSGVPLYASLTAGQLLALDTEESDRTYLTERVLTVSRIAAAKHARQRLAVALMMVAVALLVAAVLVTLA